jgi:hypothetical protein
MITLQLHSASPRKPSQYDSRRFVKVFVVNSGKEHQPALLACDMTLESHTPPVHACINLDKSQTLELAAHLQRLARDMKSTEEVNDTPPWREFV